MSLGRDISLDVHQNKSQYLGYYTLSPFISSMYVVVIFHLSAILGF